MIKDEFMERKMRQLIETEAVRWFDSTEYHDRTKGFVRMTLVTSQSYVFDFVRRSKEEAWDDMVEHMNDHHYVL